MLRSACRARLEARKSSMQAMQAYKEQFPVGTKVKIANAQVLGEFQRTWRHHHKLDSGQLAYAGKVAVIEKVGFYHGGDIVYELQGIPGIWHEQCLQPVRSDDA